MKVPNYLWGEGVRHATYIINRIAKRVLNEQTPYEALKGNKPNIEHIRVFGCVSYAKAETQHLRKIDDRSRILVHLGTEPGSKACRLLNPSSQKIVVSRDVMFDETKAWKWNEKTSDAEQRPGMFTLSMSEFGNNGVRNDPEEGFNNEDEVTTEEVKEKDNDITETTQVRKSTRISKKPSYLKDYIYLAEIEGGRLLLVINEELFEFADAIQEEVWRNACQEEITSINRNNTWTVMDLPDGAKAIGLKWIFKIKRNSDGSINKYKSRLVAKGYIQRYGVGYEEVFAPVARIETIRFIISLAASNGWKSTI